MRFIFNRIQSTVAVSISVVFLYSTVSAPLAEANFWQERRKAVQQTQNTESPFEQYAQVPSGFSDLNNALPRVTNALPGLQQIESIDETKSPETFTDTRNLPKWLSSLPSSYGDIQKIQLVPEADKRPIVVLLQDAHGIYSAQLNIAQMLGHLQDSAEKEGKGNLLVALEGSSGAYDFTPYRKCEIPEHRRMVSDFFLDHKLISGPEVFGITTKNLPTFWGVETPSLYVENVEAYRSSLSQNDNFKSLIAGLESALKPVKQQFYNLELWALDENLASYHNGDLDLLRYVRFLAGQTKDLSRFPEVGKLLEILKLEESLDFKAVEAERTQLIQVLSQKLDTKALNELLQCSLAYRAGQISYGRYYQFLQTLSKTNGFRLEKYSAFNGYIQYVLKAETIEKYKLFEEVESLKNAVIAELGKTPEQKTLLRISEDIKLLSRLQKFEFGPTEWKVYQSRRGDILNLSERITAFGVKTPAGSNLKAIAPTFEKFYSAAERRNDAMVSNLLKKAGETGSNAVVLIAGGFHTPVLETLLKSKGVSVVTLTPKVGPIDKTTHYMDVFAMKHIPLEKMLLGEKLFLRATDATSAPIVAMGAERADVVALDDAAEQTLHTARPAQVGDTDVAMALVDGRLEAVRSSRGSENRIFGWTKSHVPGILAALAATSAYYYALVIYSFQPYAYFLLPLNLLLLYIIVQLLPSSIKNPIFEISGVGRNNFLRMAVIVPVFGVLFLTLTFTMTLTIVLFSILVVGGFIRFILVRRNRASNSTSTRGQEKFALTPDLVELFGPYLDAEVVLPPGFHGGYRTYDYRWEGLIDILTGDREQLLSPAIAFRKGVTWGRMALEKADENGIPADQRFVLLARDSRKVNRELIDAIVAGLRYVGLDVLLMEDEQNPNAVSSYSSMVQIHRPLMSIFLTASHVARPDDGSLFVKEDIKDGALKIAEVKAKLVESLSVGPQTRRFVDRFLLERLGITDSMDAVQAAQVINGASDDQIIAALNAAFADDNAEAFLREASVGLSLIARVLEKLQALRQGLVDPGDQEYTRHVVVRHVLEKSYEGAITTPNIQVRGVKVAIREDGLEPKSLTTREIKEISRQRFDALLVGDNLAEARGARVGTVHQLEVSQDVNAVTVQMNALVGRVAANPAEGHTVFDLARAYDDPARDPLDILREWAEQAARSGNPRPFDGTGAKAVVDGANTPSGLLAARTLRELGIEVVELRSEVMAQSGRHKADPAKPENVKALKDRVLEMGAWFGISFDLDGDRGAMVIPTADGGIMDLSPDNLMAALLPFLVEQGGYRGSKLAVVKDVLGSRLVNVIADKLKIRVVQTDAGYVFLKAKVKELKRDGFIIPIYGEKSGHSWLDVSGAIESPIGVMVLFAVMTLKHRQTLQQDTPEYKFPGEAVYRANTEPFRQSARFQPAIADDLMRRLADQNPGKAKQELIALARDFAIRQLMEQFTPGKVITTAAGRLIVGEITPDMLVMDDDQERGLYRFFDIPFLTEDGQYAGRFVFRASANDPTYVCFFETPVRVGENSITDESVSERFAAILLAVDNFLRVNGLGATDLSQLGDRDKALIEGHMNRPVQPAPTVESFAAEVQTYFNNALRPDTSVVDGSDLGFRSVKIFIVDDQQKEMVTFNIGDEILEISIRRDAMEALMDAHGKKDLFLPALFVYVMSNRYHIPVKELALLKSTAVPPEFSQYIETIVQLAEAVVKIASVNATLPDLHAVPSRPNPTRQPDVVNVVIEMDGGTLRFIKNEIKRVKSILKLVLDRLLVWSGLPPHTAYGEIPRTRNHVLATALPNKWLQGVLRKHDLIDQDGYTGDGDPADTVFVLGTEEVSHRSLGSVAPYRVLGVILFKDTGEFDPKFIVVEDNSPLAKITLRNTEDPRGFLAELEAAQPIFSQHLLDIIDYLETYKGETGTGQVVGIGSRKTALDLLKATEQAYNTSGEAVSLTSAGSGTLTPLVRARNDKNPLASRKIGFMGGVVIAGAVVTVGGIVWSIVQSSIIIPVLVIGFLMIIVGLIGIIMRIRRSRPDNSVSSFDRGQLIPSVEPQLRDLSFAMQERTGQILASNAENIHPAIVDMTTAAAVEVSLQERATGQTLFASFVGLIQAIFASVGIVVDLNRVNEAGRSIAAALANGSNVELFSADALPGLQATVSVGNGIADKTAKDQDSLELYIRHLKEMIARSQEVVVTITNDADRQMIEMNLEGDEEHKVFFVQVALDAFGQVPLAEAWATAKAQRQGLANLGLSAVMTAYGLPDLNLDGLDPDVRANLLIVYIALTQAFVIRNAADIWNGIQKGIDAARRTLEAA